MNATNLVSKHQYTTTNLEALQTYAASLSKGHLERRALPSVLAEQVIWHKHRAVCSKLTPDLRRTPTTESVPAERAQLQVPGLEARIWNIEQMNVEGKGIPFIIGYSCNLRFGIQGLLGYIVSGVA